MQIGPKRSTISLTPALSLSAELRKMVEEDSSINLWKEILDQVQVLELLQQDVAELKRDLKQTEEKMVCYEPSFFMIPAWQIPLLLYPSRASKIKKKEHNLDLPFPSLSLELFKESGWSLLNFNWLKTKPQSQG